MPDCKASDDGKVYIRGLVWYREAAGATGERRRVPTFAASTISLDFQRTVLIKINQEIANPPVALLVKSPACRKRIVRTNLPGRAAAQENRPKPLMLGNDRCGQPAVP